MKRIIFCFDGTWNKLDPDLATNVVLAAASIERMTRGGTAQIIHYDEGVGTGELDKLRGGIFGAGLTTNIREAYRFLIFNYDPGDEIFVFGFSRGAFSARSFVGFIRHAGPLHRLHAGRIDEGLALYRNRIREGEAGLQKLREFRARYSDKVCIGASDDEWRCENIKGYVRGAAPQMTIKYMGLWDTVGAMGIPGIIPFSKKVNRKHAFHDVTIDDFVESAWHAVAIDERRKLFPFVTIGNVRNLNAQQGFADDDPDAPFQERWFPGVHGSVGGGGPIRGLSDGALAWVLRGAKNAGLRLDTSRGTRIHNFHPDPMAPLDNEEDPQKGVTDWIQGDREGPDRLDQLSTSTVRRWRTTLSEPGEHRYQPVPLQNVAGNLDQLGPIQFDPPDDLIETIEVQPGESLSLLARKYYGDAELWTWIFDANQDSIDDPDNIFAGQALRIPRGPQA